MRAQLGNDIAIKAFREGKLPFPDGTIIAALHWNEDSSDENNKVLASGFPGAGLQSFVAGSAVNVQFMVKDFKKVRRDRRLGIRRLHERQTWQRGTPQNVLPLPRARKSSRLCLHPLCTLKQRTAPTQGKRSGPHGRTSLPTASPTSSTAARRLQMTPLVSETLKLLKERGILFVGLLPLR